MQDEKEIFKGFVSTIKEKVRDWESKYQGATRISAFIFLLLFSLFVVLTYANYYRVHTNTESARYLLSALVQSQAAILAIVISLTLIAVQLTASTYSPRVISLFRDSYGWQALFVFYGISIFYGLLVLKMIKGADDLSDDLSQITYLKISLEGHISTAYALGCLTFVMLIRYLQSVINFLNPASIIKRLAIKITKDKILNSEEDPIQPIMDIVHGSIMKYDLETTRVGLKAVTEQVTKIIDSDIEEKISGLFCKHLERVGKLAVSKMDEESTAEVIENLEKLGRSTAEKGFENATALTAEFLEAVGVTAAKKDLGGATWRALESLEAVGKAAAEKDLGGATEQAAKSLENFGKAALYWTKQVAWSLVEVGRTATEKGLENATQQAAWSLIEVGRTATERGFLSAAEAAKSLAKLTLLSEEIAKTAIQDYESELEEQNRDSFQKFKRPYEQELEKLRAEK